MSIFVSKQRGFKLVEIMFVVAIIAILATVVIANVQEGRKKARDAQRISDIAQLQVAFRLYKDANIPNYTYPMEDYDFETDIVIGLGGPLDDEIQPYLPVVPKDVMGMSDSYWVSRAYAFGAPPTSSDYTYAYVYDPDYDGCTVAGVGQNRKVIYAKTMERSASSNWASICGPMPTGNPNGSNTYGVILK